jgi:vitamin B12/bleomycin/antimicrobial peptide transport system ATP-binding/permease protein
MKTMTDASAAADSGRFSSANLFLKRSLRFWAASDASGAWFWTAAALALIFANLAVNVGINRWNKWFFDALEAKNVAAIFPLVITIIALVATGAAFAVAMVKCRMTLQVKWRQWLTSQLLTRWLSEQRYYRLAVTDEEQMNPEYRIADDLRMASEPVVEFAIGFINALLAAVTFVSILFWVGGSLTVTVGNTSLWIPGYIAIAAVLYACAVSGLTYFIGNPLVARVAAKNEGEAQFRYELTRVRENARQRAALGSDPVGR